MCQHKPIGKTFCFATTTMCALVMGIASTAVGGEDETEILKITVGEPTVISSLRNQNMSTVMVSRTGVAGVIYRKPGREPRYPKHARRGSAMGYRVSTDRGVTWSKEMMAPDEFGGGQNSGTPPDGGAIIPTTDPKPSTAYTRAEGWKGEADLDPAATRKTGWYDVRLLRFTDDMMNWQEETVAIYMPNAGPPSFDVQAWQRIKGEFYTEFLAACAKAAYRHGKIFLAGTTTLCVGYVPNLVGRKEGTALRIYNDWAAWRRQAKVDGIVAI